MEMSRPTHPATTEYTTRFKALLSKFRRATIIIGASRDMKEWTDEVRDAGKQQAVEAALAACEHALPGAFDSEQGQNHYTECVTHYSIVYLHYVDDLQDLVSHPPGDTTERWRSQLAAALKVLRTDLVALHRDLKSNTAKAKAERTQHQGLDVIGETIVPKLTAAVKNAKKFCTDVKKKPTAAAFNAGIMDAARALTQMMLNLDAMVKRGAKVKLKGTAPQALMDELTPYAQGHRKLVDGASASQVKEAVAVFEGLVDQVAAWLKKTK